MRKKYSQHDGSQAEALHHHVQSISYASCMLLNTVASPEPIAQQLSEAIHALFCICQLSYLRSIKFARYYYRFRLVESKTREVLSETYIEIHHGPIHLWQIKQAGPRKSVQFSGVSFDPSLGRTFICVEFLICIYEYLVATNLCNALEPQFKLRAQHSVL